MAEKKPRIDLKARLGKKSVGSPSGAGGSIPPPVGVSRPGGGIPKPPFGEQPSGPKVDASDPYAAQAAPARAEPQAIKVEMSEEIVQAQKKARGRVAAYLLVAAIVAGFVGFLFGQGTEKSRGHDQAVASAQDLAKKVSEATAVAEQLGTVIKDATAKLKGGKYPEEEVSKLGGINIPFDAMSIDRNVARFSADTRRLAFQFLTKSQEANEQKATLARVLGGAKNRLTALLEEKDKPKVKWGALVSSGPGGPWAMMTTIPEPFLAKGEEGAKWPETITLKEGDKDVKFDRYTDGEPTSGNKPALIPINPATANAVCPSDTLRRLAGELNEMGVVLRGDETPGREEQGLIEIGRQLEEKLKQIGSPG